MGESNEKYELSSLEAKQHFNVGQLTAIGLSRIAPQSLVKMPLSCL